MRSKRLISLACCTAAFIVLLPLCFLYAQQLVPFGLQGRVVYDLRNYGGRLYAGTDDGVFVRNLSDTSWKSIGLQGKKVRAVYPHQVGPIGFAVTAGIVRAFEDSSSPLIYCSFASDTSWVPSDSGINRKELTSIRSIDGFLSPAICGETFAVGNGVIYRKQSSSWEKVYDIGIGVVNAVKANERNATVWAGGETAIFAPYIVRSDDKGKTWSATYPNLAGDNACNSLAFDPSDTSVVYAGMEGTIIKSTDGGQTWNTTSLQNTPFYFYGLAADSRALFAGGSTSMNVAGLYRSLDGGISWIPIGGASSLKGILSLVAVPTLIMPETTMLLIGTNGDGVYQSNVPTTSIEDDQLPMTFTLHQNYPNPFNPTTVISFELPVSSWVSLKIFNVLGQEVAVLVNGDRSAGVYKIEWDAKTLPSGIYLYHMRAGSFVETRKMLLLQ